MTNYEYLTKHEEETVKEALIGKGIAKAQNNITTCRGLKCNECDFDRDKNNGKPCNEGIREWLDEEHVEKPKPCPFCGSENINVSKTAHYVECNDCNVETMCYNTEEEAIEAWNRRV